MDKLIKNKKTISIALGGIIAGSVALLFILGFVSVFVKDGGVNAISWICRLLTALMLVAIGALVGILFIDKSFKNQFKISFLAYIVTLGTVFVLFILSYIMGLINVYLWHFVVALNNAIQIPFFLVNGFALVGIIKGLLQKSDDKNSLLYDLLHKNSSDKEVNDVAPEDIEESK